MLRQLFKSSDGTGRQRYTDWSGFWVRYTLEVFNHCRSTRKQPSSLPQVSRVSCSHPPCYGSVILVKTFIYEKWFCLAETSCSLILGSILSFCEMVHPGRSVGRLFARSSCLERGAYSIVFTPWHFNLALICWRFATGVLLRALD